MKLITSLLILLSVGANAAPGDSFQIADTQHHVICTYHELDTGYAESDDPAYMGTGICWDEHMMDKANFYIRSHKK